MTEQKNLTALHAPLSACLPAGACSPILSFYGVWGLAPCSPRPLNIHARTAEWQNSPFHPLFREQKLRHLCLLCIAPYMADRQARLFSLFGHAKFACRQVLSCTRMTEQKNLSALHASLPACLPAGACFLILSFHGGMGLCPMFAQALALSYPSRRAVELAFPARVAGPFPRG